MFEDANGANCASCHAGPRFSNDHTENVGTGGAFQVPSLLGLGTRGPYMHNGCAQTLKDRFLNPDCGGKNHGSTAQLTAAQIEDLSAYLDSL